MSKKALGESASEGAAACKANATCLLIPRFNGPEELGTSVATVLNLQLLQTLERARNGRWLENPAVIIWSDQPLEQPRYAEALEREPDCERQDDADQGLTKKSRSGCDLIFWGSVYQLGEEAIVLSYLSLPKSTAPVWRVKLGDSEITSTLPALNYSFKPFALSADTVDSYSSIGAIRLVDDRPLGTNFRVHRWTYRNRGEAEVWLLNEDGERQDDLGYLVLPNIEIRSDAVNFTAGVIRAYRKDWRGLVESMEEVLKNEDAELQLQIDALWYQAWALVEDGDTRRASKLLEGAIQRFQSTRLHAAMVLTQLAAFSARPQSSNMTPLVNAISDYCQAPAPDRSWINELVDKLTPLQTEYPAIAGCQEVN